MKRLKRKLTKILNSEDPILCIQENFLREKKRVETIASKGYTIVIGLFAAGDFGNYFTALGDITRYNVFMLFIISISLALILDQSSVAVCSLLFSKFKIDDNRKKYVKSIVIFAIGSVIALLLALLVVRLQTIETMQIRRIVSKTGARSVAIFFIVIAAATSIVSYLYSTAMNLVIKPRIVRRICRKYTYICQQVISILMAKCGELRRIITSPSLVDGEYKADVVRITTKFELRKTLYEDDLE